MLLAAFLTACSSPTVPIQKLHRKQPLTGQDNNQTSINHEGVRNGIHSHSGTLELWQADRAEAATQAEGHLSDPNSASERASGLRPGDVQRRDRQQAGRLPTAIYRERQLHHRQIAIHHDEFTGRVCV